jgi:hypothetical protein
VRSYSPWPRALVAALYAGAAYAKQPDPTDGENFEVYTGTVTPKQLDELRARSNHAQDHRIRPPQR